jgi:hypothetical protein
MTVDGDMLGIVAISSSFLLFPTSQSSYRRPSTSSPWSSALYVSHGLKFNPAAQHGQNSVSLSEFDKL